MHLQNPKKAILLSLELRRFGVGPHPKRAGDEPAEWKGLPWALPRQAEVFIPSNPPTNQSREPELKVSGANGMKISHKPLQGKGLP
jgi:hypothetical protein